MCITHFNGWNKIFQKDVTTTNTQMHKNKCNCIYSILNEKKNNSIPKFLNNLSAFVNTTVWLKYVSAKISKIIGGIKWRVLNSSQTVEVYFVVLVILCKNLSLLPSCLLHSRCTYIPLAETSSNLTNFIISALF